MGIGALRGLLQDSSWSVKIFAAKQIGRLKSNAATSALISDFADSDSDVAKEVLNQLQSRPLNDDHVAQLSNNLNSAS